VPPPVRAAADFGIDYRVERAEDLPFIAALYASGRAREMATFGWPPELQAAFLDQQHQAQHRHFRAAYPDAEWLVIERNGEPVGRLYIEVNELVVHGIDIALIPEMRGNGIGGAIMRDLIDYGRELGKPVTVYVEKGNPASHLYRRLGFVDYADEDKGPYELLVWREEGPAGGS